MLRWCKGALDIELKYGDTGDQRVKLHLNPRLEFFVNGEVAMTVNERNLFHFEHTQAQREVVTDDGVVSADEHAARQLGDAQPQAGDVVEPPAGKKIDDYNEHGHAIYDDGTTSADEKAAEVGEEVSKEGETPPPDVSEEEPSDGAWEESFGGHKDTKLFGPQSVGIDVTFNGMQHVYGIPEHATKFDPSRRQGAARATANRTGCTTLMSLSTSLTCPWHCMAQFPSWWDTIRSELWPPSGSTRQRLSSM